VKRFYYWFYLMMVLFVGVYILPNSLAQDSNSQKGLLWQITPPGSKPSYLLGTIHSEDPRVLKLPAKIKHHFEQADRFICEMSMDLATTLQISGAMLFTDGQTLEKLLDKPLYKQIVKVLTQRDIPLNMIKIMKPWAVIATLNAPPSETGIFLDLMLYKDAKRLQKPVYGLETAEEQLQIFASFSLEEQIILIKETLKQFNSMPKLFDKLHELYLARDLSAIMVFSKNYMRSDNEQHELLLNIFLKRLLDERNLRMIERMQSYLQKGNAFIAVGALHLPGDQGLLRLLEKQGYQVKVIY